MLAYFFINAFCDQFDKPDLTMTFNIDTSKKYNATKDQIRCTGQVKGNRTTYVTYNIQKDSTIVKNFKDTFHLTTEQTSSDINKDVPLTGLDRGDYTINVKAEYDNGVQSDKTYTTQKFKVGDQTKIVSWSFDKAVYAKGDDIKITGTYSDDDPDELLTFIVTFGDSRTEYKSSQVSSSSTKQFSITVTGLGITGKSIPVKLIARDAGNNEVASDTKNVHISDVPTLSATPKNQGHTFDYNTTLEFELSISDDDSRGFLKWYLDDDKENVHTIDYTATGGKFDQTLIIKLSENNIVYKAGNYKIMIYAQDINGIKSNEVPFSFNVLSKPSINKIDLKQRGEPGKTTYITVTFDDYDASKKLYLYATYGSSTEQISYKISNGQTSQTMRTTYTYPSQYKGTAKFILSSRSDINTQPSTNTDSDSFDLEIISTDVPKISAQWPEVDIYENGESINFNLTIEDDNSGTIKYKITGKEFARDVQANINEYKVTGSASTKKTYEISIAIPKECKYYRDYSAYYLQVQCTDDFNVTSEPVLFSYHIKNKIVLNAASVTPSLIRPDVNKQVTITAYFKNVDEERNIVMWARFGTNAPTPLYSLSTTGNNETMTTKTDVPVESALNYPIAVWLEDDFDEARDPRNGNTSVFTFYVNISKAPSMTSSCTANLAYGKDDKIKISLEVRDDTNGMIEFKIDNEVIDQQLHYNTTKGVAKLTSEISIPAKYQKFGPHTITYYPVDEFGLRPTTNDSISTCEFIFKNKPLLQGLKLSKTVADDDDPVTVSGKLVDYDAGKKVFIYQKLGSHDPISLGQIVSKGGSEQSFQYTIQKLKGIPSGNTTIEIYACDSNETIDTSKLSGNSVSDPFPLYIFMANDPELVVIFPEETVYGTNSEVISITVNITAEIQGAVYLFDSYYGAYSDDISEAVDKQSYNHSSIVTLTYRTSSYSYSNQKLYVKAIGNNGTTSEVYYKTFTIRDPPKLNSVTLAQPVFSPGDYVSPTLSITAPTYSYIYLFAKIGGNIISKTVTTGYRSTSSITFSIQLNLSQKTGPADITYWVQNTKDVVYPPAKNTKSEEITKTITVTKVPEVDFNYPQEIYYGYDDTFQCNAVIKDDTRGYILVKVDGNVIKNESYSSNNQATTKYFNFNIPKTVKYRNNRVLDYWGYASYTNEFSVTMSVVDEYGKSADQTQKFKLVNKPKVTGLSLRSSLILQDATYLQITITTNDVDSGKNLFVWSYFDDTKLNGYDSFTSNGNSKTNTITITIPKSKTVGLHTISVKVADVAYTYSTTNRNSFSNADVEPVQVTFLPTITLDPIADTYISKGQNVRLTGTLNFDTTTYCKVVVTFGSVDAKTTILDKSSLINGKYDITIPVPDGLKYGTTKMTVKAVDGNNMQSKTFGTKTFTYKNKPAIHDFSMTTDYFVTDGTVSFSLMLDDKDEGKEVYVWMQIEDEDPQNVYWGESNGKDNQLLQITNYIYTDKSGLCTVKFYVTDDEDETITGLGASNVLTQKIVFSYTPEFQVTYPNNFYYRTNEVISVSYTCDDDGDVTLYVSLNDQVIDSLKETLSPNNKKISGTKNLNLTADLFPYGYTSINIYVVDKYGFKSDDQLFYIRIINPPVIDTINMSKNYALQGDIVEFEGTFTDLDKTKNLYFYLQLGDKAVEESSYTVQSTGEKGQKFSFGLKINESETIGKKKIKVWVSSSKNPTSTYNTEYLTSKAVEFDLEVTYKPSIKLMPLVKSAYNDGEKISIRGSVTANSNVYMKFKIDSIELNVTKEIQVTENPQDFEVKLQIPENFKYGKHNLNAYALDANGLSTGLTRIEFNIQNPPRILSISLASDTVKQGGKLRVLGTVRDPDVGNMITFLAGIDLGTKTEVHELKSDSTEQEFKFEIDIPENIDFGEHDLEIIARDPDFLESSPAELTFTVVKGNNGNDDSGNSNAGSNSANKKKRSTTTGLVAGVAIVGLILVVLIVVLVVLLIKKAGNNNNAHDSGSETENDDLEDRETQIATSIPTEESTRDNPLFSASEIANDNDPFSDEFEEQERPE